MGAMERGDPVPTESQDHGSHGGGNPVPTESQDHGSQGGGILYRLSNMTTGAMAGEILYQPTESQKHGSQGGEGNHVNGRTDGRTDDGEFNSPPSSLREAGDKNQVTVAYVS